jgi:hypothetical protein
MSTNNNSTGGNDTTPPKKSWENMNTPGSKPTTSGDDTKKTGDLPTDPQPKMGNDQNKKY